ncbi:polysulfide reductase NrfD [Anaerobacillus sp. CMMVII]|uniref:NrfD/PsrC family molybdoenzyme membrane anchor subunit n=1 Tax=Anaerobacillus sp. CMMVII TaxID=2755588 RepID=UPI0021B7D31D|nr:NrfD/PsrC family molybdoenzyme membrane anchor subunit [Anaerobacillus sp. CMMVII]MCT8137547.1 polysulfide reductase NrfD [Anaerobacillus sp. CMMVII]
MLNRKVWIIISSILIIVGVAGAINVILHGEEVMGTTNYVPWGALLAAYVFFVVSSTGLSLVSSLGHVFKFKRFEVIGKRAVLGSIITLLMGFAVIALELGNPLNMIHLLFTPNFSSAIFWMGLLYGVYLVLLCFELFYMIKDDHKKSTFLGC